MFKKSTVKLSLMAAACLILANAFGESQKVAVYYANWNDNMLKIENTLKNVDEVLYAFAAVDASSGKILFTSPKNDFGMNAETPVSVEAALTYFKSSPGGNFSAMGKLKEKYPSVKFVLCLGGWGTYSGGFSKGFSTEVSRKQFISDAVKVLNGFTTSDGKCIFEGIDIDWEYPRVVIGTTADIVLPDDTQNLQKIVIDLRKKLPEGSIISMALPHGNFDLDGGSIDNYFRGIDGELLATNQQFIDSTTTFNLMAYDFMAFAPYTIPNAPLGGNQLSVEQGINALIKNGVPANKIFFGAPAYGRTIGSQTQGVRGLVASPTAENNGIGIQLPPVTSAAGEQFPCAITWPLYVSINMDNINNPDVFTNLDSVNQTVCYWDIQARKPIANKADKAIVNSDAAQQAQLQKYVDCFMCFDSPRNIAKKAEYVKKNGYAGIFFWEVNHDRPYGQGSIKIGDGTYPLSLIETAVTTLKK